MTTRRDALKVLGGGVISAMSTRTFAAGRKKVPVAAVVTAYQNNTHTDVIVGKILNGWRQQGGQGPNLELVSLYADQVPRGDMSRELAKQHGFRIAKSIDEAVTLGTDGVPVAGVLSIGEHGNYPLTPDTGQRMYPRRRFFDEIVAAMKRGGRYVPVFNDKHLSYNWADAHHMYQTAAGCKIPFMAGSSLPVAWRYPAKQIPLGSKIEDVVAVGYGGKESYAFHALEMLQSVVERRQGGETGVAKVYALTDEDIWQAERDGVWSRKLVIAALKSAKSKTENFEKRLRVDKSVLYVIEYRDGLKATVAMLSGVATQFSIACRLEGESSPFACWYRLEETKPFGHFAYLLKGIEHLIETGKSPYPVERTLLTTGILDRAIHSNAEAGKQLATPELAIRYSPSTWGFANDRVENFPE